MQVQYNTIRYKTCNAQYVTKMSFVGAGKTVKSLQNACHTWAP